MKNISQMLTSRVIILLALLCFITSAMAENSTQVSPKTNGGITLNFRGVPLDTVLDYISKTAGFVIVKEADLSGTVDVWSHQPLSNAEAIDLLNTILHEKGFAAVRNGRTLTIVDREEAIKRDIPVNTGNNPESIPKNDEMVTQIIPVRYTDAMQLIDNLQPLLPSYATMSANESSNAIVITDTQKNIRRMAEIIRALDTSISSISSVQVFKLLFADAKEVAGIIQSVFQIEEDSNNRSGGRMQFPPFMGRGDRGGRGGGEENSNSEARKAASRVVAVADERTNALVVSAPEELMPLIETMLSDIDTMTEDITEIRVFRLNYADANEMSQLITDLFDDDSNTQSNQLAPRFGRSGFGMPGGGNTSNQQDSSQRQLQQTTVTAAADSRTNSIVVTAARETMSQIEQMVIQLDSQSDKKQNVYIYKLDHADVDNVVEVLRNIFENQTTSSNNRTNTNTNANTLSNRATPADTSNQFNRGN